MELRNSDKWVSVPLRGFINRKPRPISGFAQIPNKVSVPLRGFINRKLKAFVEFAVTVKSFSPLAGIY